jgi:membrane protein implicated in regulation of membrane protease activity
MQVTVNLISLWLIVVSGLAMCLVEFRAKRLSAAVAGACFAASALVQLFEFPWSAYVSLAFSIAFAALVAADVWNRRGQIRDSFIR